MCLSKMYCYGNQILKQLKIRIVRNVTVAVGLAEVRAKKHRSKLLT